MWYENENLSWCKPYTIGKSVKFTVNEGECNTLLVDGKEIDISGCDDYFITELIANAEEKPCIECAWFSECECITREENADD